MESPSKPLEEPALKMHSVDSGPAELGQEHSPRLPATKPVASVMVAPGDGYPAPLQQNPGCWKSPFPPPRLSPVQVQTPCPPGAGGPSRGPPEWHSQGSAQPHRKGGQQSQPTKGLDGERPRSLWGRLGALSGSALDWPKAFLVTRKRGTVPHSELTLGKLKPREAMAFAQLPPRHWGNGAQIPKQNVLCNPGSGCSAEDSPGRHRQDPPRGPKRPILPSLSCSRKGESSLSFVCCPRPATAQAGPASPPGTLLRSFGGDLEDGHPQWLSFPARR